MRTPAQPIRLINQQINPLAALQHPLDILRHDVPHAVDFLPRGRQRVGRRGGVEGLDERAQFGVERGAAVGGEGGEVGAGGRVGGEELALHFEEVGEGDAAALFGGCDDDVAEWCVGVGLGGRGGLVGGGAGRGVGDVVHEEAFMGEGELLGLVMGDLGEDD